MVQNEASYAVGPKVHIVIHPLHHLHFSGYKDIGIDTIEPLLLRRHTRITVGQYGY